MVVQEDILDAITVLHTIDPNQGNLEEVEVLEDIQHQPLELLVLHQEVEERDMETAALSHVVNLAHVAAVAEVLEEDMVKIVVVEVEV
jgi:hypothetical protein